MPKKAHTEEQIVAVLRQGEAGEKVAEICRKVGISEGTYYAWGSGSRHDGDESSAGTGASESRARTSAGQHYGGQWQRVQQSCPGSLGDEP
jgi:hypothetical protein